MIAPSGGSLHPPAAADWVAPCWGAPAPREKETAEARRKNSERDCRVWAKPDAGERRESERKAEEKAGKEGMK